MQKLNIKRKFTTKEGGPYNDITWNNVIADIPGSGFHRENLIFPSTFSQTAINIIASKYFITPFENGIGESDFRQLIERLVYTMALWGVSQGYFGKKSIEFMEDTLGQGNSLEDEMKLNVWKYFYVIDSLREQNEDIAIYVDEMLYILSHQYAAFNSPVWMNLGNYTRKTGYQSSACFILSIEDTMESIEENVGIEMEIFRQGSGAGTNLSPLRSSKEHLSSGGKSSGPISFMKIYDTAASVTKSGGTTRRAARMNELDDDHGDVLDFISCKSNEEKKAKALIDAGYSADFNDPNGAYNSVFFQNVNISIHAKNALFNATRKKEDWALISRHPSGINLDLTEDFKETSQGKFNVDEYGDYYLVIGDDYTTNKNYKVIEWIKAEDMLLSIAQNTWISGDPGLQYHDMINKYNTCSNDAKIKGSNPCSEFTFLDNTSCNLSSTNLMKFYNLETKTFDSLSFIHTNRFMTLSMEILVDYSKYPIEKIGIATKKYRPLGVGYSNLGAILLSNGIAYNSDRGRWFARGITALMNASVYQMSSELAGITGSFERFEANKTSMHKVINLYKNDINKDLTKANRTIYKKFVHLFTEAKEIYDTFNENTKYRNAQATLMAPCGTIGFAMDNSTTGIEPAFSLVSYKTLVGGGVLKLTLREIIYGLEALKYTQTEISEITKFIEKHETIIGSGLKEEHYNVFETAVGDNQITPEGHVDMMGAIQPYLSGAISKTANMPNTATVEDIYNLFFKGWEKGLKALAIYRDGSKQFQPINTKKEELEKVKLITQGTRNRLPKECKSDRINFRIGMQSGYMHTGKYENGKIGEIWIRMSKQGSTLSGLMDALSMSISIGLQYGTPIESFIKVFKGMKFEPAGMTDVKSIRFAESIPDFLGKWLEQKYVNIEEDIKVESELDVDDEDITIESSNLDGPPCASCGGLTQRKGNCYVCSICGTTTGCG